MLPERDLHIAEEEVGVAAVSYIPPLFLIFIFWKKWRLNYYTYYHARHALLLNSINAIILFLGVGFSIIFATSFDSYFSIMLISGMMITGSLLMVTFFSFFCLIQAYRGRYVVIPIVTSLYYLIFERVFSFQHSISQEGDQAPIDAHSFSNFLKSRKDKPKNS